MLKKSAALEVPATVLKRAREEHPGLVEQLADPVQRHRAHAALSQLYPEMRARSRTKWIVAAAVGLTLLIISIVGFSGGGSDSSDSGGDRSATHGEENGGALLRYGWAPGHVLEGHEEEVWSVAIAQDGTWLASSSYDGMVRIWDVETGRIRHELKAFKESAGDVAIAPDGTWLASWGDGATVRVWDSATGRERQVLREHEDAVADVAIAPDGTWLASVSADKTARVWNAKTGRVRHVLHGHEKKVGSVAIAPDGTWLASASHDHTVRIWDVETGRARHVLRGHEGQVYEVAIAPDGSWLASASHDHTVRIWDVATGRERQALRGHDSVVFGVAIAPDGTWLASAASGDQVRIWDVATGRTRHILRPDYSLGMIDVVIDPDSAWVAAGLLDGTVRLWDAETGRESHVLRGHGEEPASYVAIAPDGAWLASASYDRTVCIWDAEMVPQTEPSPHTSAAAKTNHGENRAEHPNHHTITITSASGEIRHNGVGIIPPFRRNKLIELLGDPSAVEDLGGLIELQWAHLGAQCQEMPSGEIEGVTIRVTPISEPEWDNVQPAFPGLLAVDGQMLTDLTGPSELSRHGFARAQRNLWIKKHVWITFNANTGGLNTVHIHRAPNMFD